MRVQMRAEILRVHRAVTATAVYVIYDQTEGLTMVDRIVGMHEARVQQVGRPEELDDHPVNWFVADLIGAPAMGVPRVRDLPGRGPSPRGGARVRIDLPSDPGADVPPAPGSKVVAGVRPEYMDEAPIASVGHYFRSDVSGVVEVIEPIGLEQHVLVDVSGEKLAARTKRHSSIRPGQNVAFSVDGSLVGLFEPENGKVFV